MEIQKETPLRATVADSLVHISVLESDGAVSEKFYQYPPNTTPPIPQMGEFLLDRDGNAVGITKVTHRYSTENLVLNGNEVIAIRHGVIVIAKERGK